MSDAGLLILGAGEVSALLADREAEVIDVVKKAYIAHRDGQSSLPHSTFLRFPGNETDRIIALPAFLGDGFDVAGVKWIASFPGNVRHGQPRASAVLILNDIRTGRPEAILEGSVISSRRTAASAALGATVVLEGKTPGTVGLIGTGPINLDIARFLNVAIGARSFLLYNLDVERVAHFVSLLRASIGGVEAAIAQNAEEVLASCRLVSFATTAGRPHVHDLSVCPAGAVLLHISLRDLSPAAILACDNVVDDVDHVCRAQTSVHLAEQATGGREFIRCTLADILKGSAPARRGDGAIAVFSPFGLGVLDVAVGSFVLASARTGGRGTRVGSFLPAGD